VVVSSLLQYLNRNSIVKKALKTIRRDVRIAARQESVREEETDQHLKQYVPSVAQRLRFLSNLQVRDRFTAVIALEPEETVTRKVT